MRKRFGRGLARAVRSFPPRTCFVGGKKSLSQGHHDELALALACFATEQFRGAAPSGITRHTRHRFHDPA